MARRMEKNLINFPSFQWCLCANMCGGHHHQCGKQRAQNTLALVMCISLWKGSKGTCVRSPATRTCSSLRQASSQVCTPL